MLWTRGVFPLIYFGFTGTAPGAFLVAYLWRKYFSIPFQVRMTFFFFSVLVRFPIFTDCKYIFLLTHFLPHDAFKTVTFPSKLSDTLISPTFIFVFCHSPFQICSTTALHPHLHFLKVSIQDPFLWDLWQPFTTFLAEAFQDKVSNQD